MAELDQIYKQYIPHIDLPFLEPNEIPLVQKSITDRLYFVSMDCLTKL
jgi:hypothetical protein